jgi:site-specific DNA-methyltransferase (adenine-specific)
MPPDIDLTTIETPYHDLLPALSTEEYDMLLADIGANGQMVPIVVDGPTNTLIDGHHRLRVCQQLGIVPKVEVVEDVYPLLRALKLNVNRRNLSPDQFSVIRQIIKTQALQMVADGMTQAEVAAVAGVTQQAVQQWLDSETKTSTGNSFKPDNRVKVPAKTRPIVLARSDAGETNTAIAADLKVTPQAIGKIIAAERAKQAEAEARQVQADTIQPDAEGDGWKMLHGDFRERLADVPDGSVDLIVTDPPYPAEFLPLWSDLAEVAARILKPSGVLAAMSGKIHLDQVMRSLGEHLQYGWMYAQPLPGSHTRVLARHVLQAWKPWLAYSNGPWPSGQIDWHKDLLDDVSRHKARYRWEQDPDGCRLMIETLTQPDAIILDPFAGTGAFGVATLDLGRNFIGLELDADRYQTIVERLGSDT